MEGQNMLGSESTNTKGFCPEQAYYVNMYY